MLTASIVTYHNRISEIKRVIDCVCRSSIEKLYIIDNSRNDALRIFEKYSSKIRYIHNANIGYGGAHNLAINEAIDLGSEYHVVINPDIYFEPDIIDTMVVYADTDHTIGWVMPRVVYPDGRLQYLCKLLPTPADLIFRRFLPEKIFPCLRNRFEMRDTGYDRTMNIPYLSGCFMFLRITALKQVGLFDERFFMYGEDIDLSRRMHAEYRTMYYPKITIIHAHERASYKSLKMLWIHTLNIVRYFNKWGWFFDKERRRMNKCALDDVKMQSINSI